MRSLAAPALAGLLLSAGVLAQQPSEPAPAPPPRATPAVGRTQAATGNEMLEIWQIDLDPSGTGFALGKPVLEGDVYVFKVWPERETARLPKSKVKKITQRTKNLDQEVVYQIDLVPTGRMIAREEPTLKGTTYTFHNWKAGALMSLRQADVQKITKVTGMAAFKIQQEERGASLNGTLPMQGGGTVTILPGGPADAAPAAAPAPAPTGNWTYQGQPGVTDGYAPPSAVVASPGDVPKAAPQPTPQPH